MKDTGVSMDYIILLKGVNEFKKEPFPLCPEDRCYTELVQRQRDVWEGLDTITSESVENVVIEFLCRYMVQYTYRINREELAKALRYLNKHRALLAPKRLLDLNFNESMTFDRGQTSAYNVIVEMYEAITDVYGVGPTSASKILHGINPQLFMMWDDNIRPGFGYFNGDSKDYLNFMADCQKILKKIVKSYQLKFKCDIPVAIKEICEKAYPELEVKKSLAKLLDEYNFMNFTKNKKLPNPWLDP
jgi:hypothetical protein